MPFYKNIRVIKSGNVWPFTKRSQYFFLVAYFISCFSRCAWFSISLKNRKTALSYFGLNEKKLWIWEKKLDIFENPASSVSGFFPVFCRNQISFLGFRFLFNFVYQSTRLAQDVSTTEDLFWFNYFSTWIGSWKR